MSVKKAVYLIGLVILLSCDVPEKEQGIQLNYDHSNSRSTARDDITRHNIVVNPNVADTDLDYNMSATVTVPVDITLTVDYKNYALQYPDIYYEYGSSNPFTVTYNSPDSLSITILTSVNSNYPVDEIIDEEPIIDNTTIDNETIDNETIDNVTVTDNVTGYTDNKTWNDNFTYNVISTQGQKAAWIDFWDNLSVSDNWTYISVGNIDNVTQFCDNTTVVSQIITQLQNDNTTNWNSSCDNVSWVTGGCGQGIELKATTLTNTGDCQCNNPGDNVTTVRPAIRNKNWGGVGDSCRAPTQSLEVILKK